MHDVQAYRHLQDMSEAIQAMTFRLLLDIVLWQREVDLDDFIQCAEEAGIWHRWSVSQGTDSASMGEILGRLNRSHEQKD